MSLSSLSLSLLFLSLPLTHTLSLLYLSAGLIVTPLLAASFQTTEYNASAVLGNATLEPDAINLVALLLR
jgi:hypothetical protein